MKQLVWPSKLASSGSLVRVATNVQTSTSYCRVFSSLGNLGAVLAHVDVLGLKMVVLR
jgi:hypothetical protein